MYIVTLMVGGSSRSSRRPGRGSTCRHWRGRGWWLSGRPGVGLFFFFVGPSRGPLCGRYLTRPS
jgi:hypothetical protein